MSNIFEWISENAHWIFDGIGVTLLVCIGGFIFKKNNRWRYNNKWSSI